MARCALEIGCGQGPKSNAIAPLFKSFTGIDLDAEAIPIARTRAQVLGLKNTEFLAASIAATRRGRPSP